MAAGQFEKTDSGMQGLFTALDTQIENMDKASQKVDGIRQDITSHFRSNVAATPFLNKIDEWQATYRQVSRTAIDILEKLVGSDHIIENAVGDAGQQGGSWTPTADLTFVALTS
jgi:uncharacterized membrane-anchored protein YhcB (DUF1043 family)